MKQFKQQKPYTKKHQQQQKPYNPIEIKTVFYEENGVKLSHAVDHKKGWCGFGLQLPNSDKTEVYLSIEEVFKIITAKSTKSGLGDKDLVDGGKARKAYATYKEKALPGSTYISYFIFLAKQAKERQKKQQNEK
jgi:hypothetical protein|nr:MAG TPA: hypothetical protein [Caudoviricetes sp.]